MRYVYVLTPGFASWNSIGFLSPLIVFGRELRDYGYEIRFTGSVANIPNGATVIFDSKLLKPLWEESPAIAIQQLERAREKSRCLIYANNSDSGAIDRRDPMDFCDIYLKASMFKDTTTYKRPLYGGRYYTDYFHKTLKVVDDHEIFSAVLSGTDIDKLMVGWNTGLANYSKYSTYIHRLIRCIPPSSALKRILAFKRDSTHSENSRRDWGSIQYRGFAGYQRRSVGHQRRLLSDKVSVYVHNNKKLSRSKYWDELACVGSVLSPFGLGEITLKDFEVFIQGALLIKPSMQHVVTWPNFYRPGETTLECKISLEDIDALVDYVQSNPSIVRSIARNGQNLYMEYTSGPKAASHFCKNFTRIIKGQ